MLMQFGHSNAAHSPQPQSFTTMFTVNHHDHACMFIELVDVVCTIIIYAYIFFAQAFDLLTLHVRRNVISVETWYRTTDVYVYQCRSQE